MLDTPIELIGLTNRCENDSYNFMALKLISKLLPKGVNLSIFDIADIPFYDPGHENVKLPMSVENLQNKLLQAQGLVIFTPEYNHSLPARIKNCLDWLSRIKPNPLIDLPTMIGSVATGHLGGARVQYELRRVLDSQQALTLIKPEVFIGNAKLKFNQYGECEDQGTIEILGKQLSVFLDLLKKSMVLKSTIEV